MLRQYQEEIERLRNLLDNRQSTPLKIEDVSDDTHYEINRNVSFTDNKHTDLKRDVLLHKYQDEMSKLKCLHENEKNEKERILKEIDKIKTEYQTHIEKLSQDMESQKPKITSKDEILNRIQALKASMIGGEKADDKELSDRRKRKKIAAEKRLRFDYRPFCSMIFNKTFLF